jgi:hypothetical protein
MLRLGAVQHLMTAIRLGQQLGAFARRAAQGSRPWRSQGDRPDHVYPNVQEARCTGS